MKSEQDLLVEALAKAKKAKRALQKMAEALHTLSLDMDDDIAGRSLWPNHHLDLTIQDIQERLDKFPKETVLTGPLGNIYVTKVDGVIHVKLPTRIRLDHGDLKG